MSKIRNDKYYTSVDLAKKYIKKTFDVIGEDNITNIIEPSAGNGSFSNQMVCEAYDILPEHEAIITQDYLKLDKDYLKGRLIIGNPPFGDSLHLGRKFFKKSVEIADYIAFILPISQLNNTNTMYEFDLIYSEDMGKKKYSNIELHCCFNIYKRPANGLNKKQKIKLKDIDIIREDTKKYTETKVYDLRMCYRGDGSAGKILEEGESYSSEYKIIINNKELKEEIISVLKKVDWKKELNNISMLKIQQFHIHKILKREIPNIK